MATVVERRGVAGFTRALLATHALPTDAPWHDPAVFAAMLRLPFASGGSSRRTRSRTNHGLLTDLGSRAEQDSP